MEYLLKVQKEDGKPTVLGVFNKMQTIETVKEYMKTKYTIIIKPIIKEK